jgi:hypothetical protein
MRNAPSLITESLGMSKILPTSSRGSKSDRTSLRGSSACVPASELVNFAAMADLEDKNHQSIMFEGADYAVVSHPVLPEPAPGSLQTSSDLSWIVQTCDALARRNFTIRRSTVLSSFSSSFMAAGSNSIFHAMAPHYFFKRDRFGAPRPDFRQALLGEIDVFEIFEMLENGFPGVIGLGASGALGQALEAFFDGCGKAYG